MNVSKRDTEPSSPSSTPTGVAARLIENWLANTAERGFEIPFCQLLMEEGHTIIHIDSHSALEDGKDVITLGADGAPTAFQLKAGDIDVVKWRTEVMPEVEEMLDFPIHHPRLKDQFPAGYLVCTGRVNVNAIHKIEMFNQARKLKGRDAVHVVQGPELATRFMKAHGTFFPAEPSDFMTFLRTILTEGREMLDAGEFAGFLETVFHATDQAGLVARRALSSGLILTGYSLGAQARVGNHFAECTGWALAASYIARFASTLHLEPKFWKNSFDLAVTAAEFALDRLAQEALAAQDLVVEPTPWEGFPVYGARALMLGGACSIWSIIRRSKGLDGRDGEVREFLSKYSRTFFWWGESATPYLMAIAWFLERTAVTAIEGENVVGSAIDHVLQVNGENMIGAPPPHYTVSQCLLHFCAADKTVFARDGFRKHTFTTMALVDHLARRLRKQALKLRWPGISDLAMCEMVFEDSREYLTWRAEKGVLRQWFVQRPSEWGKVAAEAEAIDTSPLPSVFFQSPSFLMLFPLIIPHRFSRSLVKAVDDLLARI